MKSTILFLAFFLPIFSFAQQTEGEVIYTETIKFTLDLPEDMAQEMKDKIPSSQSVSKSLKFNEKASLYSNWEADETEDVEVEHSTNDGMQFKMKIDRPENTYYADHENGTFINSQEFFGRMFLINGGSEHCQWKLTGEQKKVNDYVCQKATCTDKEEEITAWFTPQIPVSTGPSGYGGLPGLILEIDVNNGERIFSATKINLKQLEKNAIAAPEKGKKVSKEEFKKIRDEKMKEMNAEMGGSGGAMKVIIRN